LLAGCNDGAREGDGPLTLEDLSEWRNYNYALDTQPVAEGLKHFFSEYPVETTADRHVKKFYEEHPQLLWITSQGLLPNADTLLAVLQREVPAAGLSERAFYIDMVKQARDRFLHFDFDSLHPASLEATQLDYLLTKAYVRYAVGQRYGFVNPKQLFNTLDVKESDTARHYIKYCRLFDMKCDVPDYDEPFRKLLNDSLREYLSEVKPQDLVYTQFQNQLSQSVDEDRQRLLLNMERRRWRMDRVETKPNYIFVNVAAQHLWAVAGDSVLPMRICCGTMKTKSPLLASAITHMQINPNWSIPYSIVRNDVARHGGDSAYFARHRYYITGPSGAVDPSNVSTSMLLSGRYHVSQKGGAGNSLGRIVFRFPNNFAVYLHDTSNRGAFNYKNRRLSHGCIRVQKPFELAQFMLPDADDWTLDKIRISMDLKPETEKGQQYLKEHADDEKPFQLVRTQQVEPNMPVVIDYYTVYPNPKTGQLETWPDGYGYDKVLAQAMSPFLP